MTYPFAKRTDWPLGENLLSQVIAARREKGQEILDLTESNPTRCGFHYPREVFLEPLAQEAALQYDPQSKGLLKVREALAGYYAAKSAALTAEQFILTASTSEGYSFLFRLLMEPGESVLIPAPSYPLFSYLADINDVQVSHYYLRLEEGRWRINFESIEQAISDKTRAIVLVSPNNPTGSFIKADELAQLNQLCAAHKIAIISDEVFADYVFPEYRTEFISLAQNSQVLSFVLGGLSKALALPQMKLSWIAASGPKEIVVQALERLEIIADTYLSVNTPVQHAAVAWLQDLSILRDQVMARVSGNYAQLVRQVKEAGIGECLICEGGWYALLRMPAETIDEQRVVDILQKTGVLVHPGFFFDMSDEEMIVLSLLPEPRVFQEGAKRLLKAF